MRSTKEIPTSARMLAAALAPVLGTTVALSACSSSTSSGSGECATASVLSPVYGPSRTHRGVVATVPHLGAGAVGLEVSFRTVTGQWEDSYPIPGPFLDAADWRVVVGLKAGGGPVQFSFAEVVSTDQSERPALGHVALSAETTGHAQPWSSVKYDGVLPAWPQTPSTVPAC